MKKLFTFFFVMIASVTLMAQVTTSSINGKISDKKKEALLGATIVATHTPSGTHYYAVADNNGMYHLLNIRSGGPYKMEVKMMGFQDIVKDNITVALGENMTLNFVMTDKVVGLEEVTISAQNQSHTHSGATTKINSEQIASLPTISRNLNDVLSLTPQASTTSTGLAIGGGNFRQSYFTVDGASFHNAYGIGSNLPAGGTPISLEALDAINISIAPYDVRHSGFTGGMVNAVTKSGSNQLQVSVYNYFTNHNLNGIKYGVKDENGMFPEQLKLNRAIENTSGFAVGGAIKKNKLFYFVNFEYQTEIDGGQDRFARSSEMSEWGGNTQYNRPTIEKMNLIRQYLIDTYQYDPGAYQDYSFNTPDYRLLARLDWNINKNNKFTIRYTDSKYQVFSTPSNSITPLSSSLYNKNKYGRVTDYALYFESSCYYQERNFRSVAAELNSSFLGGKLNNTLRTVYSLQHEPRHLTRALFPTVDILEPLEDGTKAVYTSFGPDPFTYGTGSYVHTFIATDEVSYAKGIHNINGGVQFEFDKTINGFMQGGAGYYVYNSWNDFVNHAAPAAFTITYGNNDKHEQAFPSFNYLQYSVYAQDEMSLSDRFKLSAGVRLELPVYPSIGGFNRNLEFDSLAALPTTIQGLSTADMPQAKPNVSPRLGFKWDILENQKLTLHGGTGIYTGRMPLVWIVTAVCNSNIAQYQYITYTDSVSFHSNLETIIANNSDKLKTGDLPAPQYATLMDKNLKMPSTWKSSLVLDAILPGDIKASIEGVYSKDLSSVALTRLGIVQDDSIQLPGEQVKRAHWVSEGIKNSVGGTVNPYLITNSKQNGHYFSFTGQVSKQFNFGLELMASYTFSQGLNVFDGYSDQLMTAFTTNTFGVHGSNSQEIGYSAYVSPHHLLMNAGWTWATGQHTTERLCVYYEGFNHSFVGSESYTRYSYTMSSNVNGDGGANSLIYIPNEDQLIGNDANKLMPFVSADNAKAFNDFINADKYLDAHRGEYAMRGAAIAPWRSTINLRYERTYKFHDGEALSFGVDVKNLGNLFYRGWGNIRQLDSSDILKLTGNGTEENPYQYQFIEPQWHDYAGKLSTWSAALNLRFDF